MGKIIAAAIIVVAVIGFVVFRGNKASAPAPMQANEKPSAGSTSSYR